MDLEVRELDWQKCVMHQEHRAAAENNGLLLLLEKRQCDGFGNTRAILVLDLVHQLRKLRPCFVVYLWNDQLVDNVQGARGLRIAGGQGATRAAQCTLTRVREESRNVRDTVIGQQDASTQLASGHLGARVKYEKDGCNPREWMVPTVKKKRPML